MSVQFGKCNFDGKPVDPKDLEEVRPVLAPYGPDGEGYICKDNFAVLCCAFHTTKESRREVEPHTSASGFVLTWDGRLDNREDLIRHFRDTVTFDSTDIEIVAAAFQCLGTDAFAKLIGDWALSIWDPTDQSITLAKDFIGTRHLYYSLEPEQIVWCTILDHLVLFARRQFKFEEEYTAGWLSFFPATRLTPYVGIHAVPPSSFIRVRRGSQEIKKYWDFDPEKKIRYRTDSEYEEHFRTVFSESVRRRLRSEKTILAELSGGIDSSSVVCMADQILNRGIAEAPRLDTVSYYDDSEPNWNERPFFATVEKCRGRTGCHIDIGNQTSFAFNIGEHFAATPACLGRHSKSDDLFADCVRSHNSRVLLSGIGGDEVAGGPPSPEPELADLLATFRFGALAHRTKAWSLQKRKPWFHLLFGMVRRFLPSALPIGPRNSALTSILEPRFVSRNLSALRGYPQRWRFFGALPSFQESTSTFNTLQRQLACSPLSKDPTFEMRYPYLDRCLLEFLFAVPREQLVRPGHRRSLVRRAFVGIVPQEILARRRKAYTQRAPRTIIANDGLALLNKLSTRSIGFHIVDWRGLSAILDKIRLGHDAEMVPLLRLIAVEAWLDNLAHTARSHFVSSCPPELNLSSMQISAEKIQL